MTFAYVLMYLITQSHEINNPFMVKYFKYKYLTSEKIGFFSSAINQKWENALHFPFHLCKLLEIVDTLKCLQSFLIVSVKS